MSSKFSDLLQKNFRAKKKILFFIPFLNKLPRRRAYEVLNEVYNANIINSDPKGRGIKPYLLFRRSGTQRRIKEHLIYCLF